MTCRPHRQLESLKRQQRIHPKLLAEPDVQAREIAWAGEAERRIDAYDAGSLPARGAQEVLAALQKHR